jgi:hypothetical protein
MTYKYFSIRREINETNPERGLKGFRTFEEMKKLFSVFHWTILVLMILSLIAFAVLALSPINDFFALIPVAVVYLCSFIYEAKGSSLLNPEAKQKELEKQDIAYLKYIGKVKEILNKNGINTKAKREMLRNECEIVLNSYDEKFTGIRNRIIDIAIGIPIGALISNLVSKDGNSLIPEVFVIVFIGIMIVVSLRLFKKIYFYSEGYFKDKQMLNALREVEYSFEE